MKISKKAEYGLTAMVHIAKSHAGLPAQAGKNKQAISIREISNTEGVPFEFLGKIFSSLEKANLVAAKHGMNGGYYLAKSASKISVNDIVSALEKNRKIVDCVLCGKKNCASKSVWAKLESAIDKTLKSITLQNLIK